MRRRYSKRTVEDIAFEREVARAVNGLPEWVRRRMDNLAIVIEEEPLPEEREYGEGVLYALYYGPSVGSESAPFSLPPRIVLFRRQLRNDFGRGGRLRREIKRTIIHEVGHHFGMSEAEIARLGYG